MFHFFRTFAAKEEMNMKMKDGKRPLILISNDDGFEAKGINVLSAIAREYGDVVVVAPDGGRSGASLSVTFQRVLTTRMVKEDQGLKVYACNGSPCDCVKIGLSEFCDRKPDLVLGGINHGDNSAVNVHYSGTMGVVIEGCLKGIPSIGFSHCSHSMDTDFTPMVPYIRKVMEFVLKGGLPKGVCLNVNAPDVPEYKGMKVCKMGQGEWTKELEGRMSPRGYQYYWLVGEFASSDKPDDNSDWNGLKEGYVTITPTKVDITAYEVMEELTELTIDN